MYISEPEVIVDPMVYCNTSNDIILTCNIIKNDTNAWQNRWMHYRNNVFIRTYSGSGSSRESVWNIRYCDYQDAGEYVCSWTYNHTEVSASSVVIVYGNHACFLMLSKLYNIFFYLRFFVIDRIKEF